MYHSNAHLKSKVKKENSMKKLKQKRLLALLAGFCFLLSLIAGLFFVFDEHNTAFAEEGAESALRFMLFNNNAEYKVTVSDKSLTEAKIPAYYNGLPVTEVADNAFMSCA